MVAADIRLDDPCRVDIFLDCVVEHIVLIKHLDKMWVRFLCDKDQCGAEDRRYDQHDNGDRHTDGHCHDQGKYDHDRRPCQQTDGEHIRHLHVRDIRGHPCHKAGC